MKKMAVGLPSIFSEQIGLNAPSANCTNAQMKTPHGRSTHWGNATKWLNFTNYTITGAIFRII